MQNEKEFDDIKGEEDNINVMSLVDWERLKIEQSFRPLMLPFATRHSIIMMLVPTWPE